MSSFFKFFSKFKTFFKLIKSLRWVSEWNSLNRRPDVLFICGDVDRGTMMEGKLYSQFLDPMAFSLEKKGYFVNRITWPISTQLPSQQLFRYININLLMILPFNWPLTFFFRFLCFPKLIVAIGWNERLLKIAKKNGIMTIEILHGFGLTKNDPDYGINSMIKLLPDVFIAFDDQYFETISSNKYKNFNVYRCRHPYIERKQFTDQQTRDLDILHIRNGQKQGLKVILITLQHGYEGTRKFLNGIIPNGIIHDQLVKTILHNPQYYWIIKAHPVQLASSQWKSIKEYLLSTFRNCPNVDVSNSHFEDITRLLVQVDLHVTMMSSAITEAATFGCPSIGLCPTLKEGNLAEYACQNARETNLLTLCELDSIQIEQTIINIFNLHSRVMVNRPKDICIDEGYPLASEIIYSLLTDQLKAEQVGLIK